MRPLNFPVALGIPTLTIFLCLLCSGLRAQDQARPNVLFIMTDQQSYTMLSAMKTAGLSTPNMDKLAARGYRFNKTYVTNPVCMPSRFSLMTGRYSSEIGVKQNLKSYSPEKLNAILRTNALGVVFRKAGYRTLYSGKTHLYGDRGATRYGFEFNSDNPYEEPVRYAKKVFSEIRQTGDKQPFFLFLSFLNPHDICYKAGMDKRYPDKLTGDRAEATKRYLAYRDSLPATEYQRQVPPEAKNLAGLDDLTFEMYRAAGPGLGWDDDQRGLYRWMYNRLTEDVDRLIGEVLTSLEVNGLKENTLVVFTSDHGEMNGAHNLILKNVMFEEAQRVPFIFAGPGVRQGVANDTSLVCNGLDLLPTLCDLTGTEHPPGLTGISLASHLTSRGEPQSRELLFTESYNSYQVTDGRHKLTLYELPDNPEVLTDIKVDPGEENNYADEPEYASVQNNLKISLYRHLLNRGVLPLRQDRTFTAVKREDREIRAILRGN